MGNLTYEKFINYKKIKDIQELITEKQIFQINNICRHYDTTTIKNRLDSIRQFIICGVEDHWLGRIGVIRKKLKTDTISEYSCKIRYGCKWEEKLKELKEKVRYSKEKFIEKYGYDEGLIEFEKRKLQCRSYGKDIMIERYGEEVGEKKWYKTLSQKIQTMSDRKKIKPYRNGNTLNEYQQRYGVKVGYNKWIEKNRKQKYRFSLIYYIDKFGENKGLEKWEEYCKSMIKTTLKSFIDRYGQKMGKDRYGKYIERMKYVQSKEYYIDKYGIDDGEIKYKELLISKISNFKDNYSKISQDLFWEIYGRLLNEYRKKCYFYELNYEHSFYVWENNMTLIQVDFKMGDKIIEFDGDYWHSKEDQIKKDIMRDDFLNKKGYLVKRIKECDYRSNKEIIINECLEFLKDG
jgi:hypothetical protein